MPSFEISPAQIWDSNAEPQGQASLSTNVKGNSYLIECILVILGGEKNVLENSYLEMEVLINFKTAGCQEDAICHLESAGRAVNSPGSQQMMTEKDWTREEQMTFLDQYYT